MTVKRFIFLSIVWFFELASRRVVWVGFGRIVIFLMAILCFSGCFLDYELQDETGADDLYENQGIKTDSDKATETSVCPYECMSEAVCTKLVGGIVHGELTCTVNMDICCKPPSSTDLYTDTDTDTETGTDTYTNCDTDTDSDIDVDLMYRIVPVSDTSKSLGLRAVIDQGNVSVLDNSASSGSKMRWTLKFVDGYFEIQTVRNPELDLLLHATGAEDFADVQIRTYASSNAQIWKIEHLGHGKYKLTSKEAWLDEIDAVLTACPLETCPGIKDVHPDAVIQAWHGGDNQKWMFLSRTSQDTQGDQDSETEFGPCPTGKELGPTVEDLDLIDGSGRANYEYEDFCVDGEIMDGFRGFFRDRQGDVVHGKILSLMDAM